jgi:peptidoglycan hydrolase-like protein with peptidoglycan-binding domain
MVFLDIPDPQRTIRRCLLSLKSVNWSKHKIAQATGKSGGLCYIKYADYQKKGSKGKEVQILQIIVGADPDGDFGSGTESKIKTWRKKHGLTVDGIVGSKSWKVGLESV